MAQKRRLQLSPTPDDNDEFAFDPTIDVPSLRKSISDRRIENRRNKALDLGLRVPSRKHDSFRVTDTSYTRQNIKIDNQGITSQSQDEEKTITPKHQSFIKDISEIKMLNALGSGASGYVCQAIHIPTKRMIAIKEISVYEKSRRNQIMNEFNALQNTDCDGLVECYGIFFSKGSVLIALEYCECGSLYDILKKVQTIPEPALAIISMNLLQGLHILHTQKKQVHRDLKPSNLVMNARGEAKLTDFGISRELKDSLGKCRSYVGTYTYMSPERIRAEPYSFKSDIWGFGLSLMECAIGAFPYPKTEFYLEMIQYIVTEPAPTLPKNMNFTPEFHDFLQQCINKDPSKRPTAKQLQQHAWIRNHVRSDFDIKKWIDANHLIINVPQLHVHSL
eukprot:677753_1